MITNYGYIPLILTTKYSSRSLSNYHAPMGIIEQVKELRTAFTEKTLSIEAINPAERRRLSQNNLPLYPVWFYAPSRGIPRDENIGEVRHFAKSVWVQMVENAIIKAVTSTDWDIIVDEDDVDESQYKEDIKYAKHFLQYPSRQEDHDFDYFCTTALTDILEIDAGVLYLNMMNGGETLAEILPFDGSSFYKENNEHGFIKSYWQYSFRHPMNAPIEFKPENIVYLQMKRRTYSPYGYAPLQAIQQVVELLDQSTRYNKDFFKNNAIPKLLLGLAGANADTIKKFKSEWLKQVEGENASMMAVGTAPGPNGLQAQQLVLSNREMEWLDGQKWYMHLVFAAYGLSPSEVGITDSTHGKNVQEGQERISIKNAHLPYLNILEKAINRQIIPRIFGEHKLNPMKRKPLKFKWFPRNAEMEKMEADGQRADVMAHLLTINEVRKERGLAPLTQPQAEDPFYVDPSLQQRLEGAKDGKNDKEIEREKDAPQDQRKDFGGGRVNGEAVALNNPPEIIVEKEPIKDFSPPTVDHSITKNEPAVVTAKAYDEFFDNLMLEWKENVVKAIDRKLYKGVRRTVFLKDFSSFLQGLVGSLVIGPFLKSLVASMKATLQRGVDEAEEELDMNVILDLNRLAESKATEQMDGYTIPGGDKWSGIRGVSKALQTRIYNEVKNGFENQESKQAIIQRVETVFVGVKNSRAATIVRTETTRLVNEGKLRSYKESGVEGRKQWVAFSDDRTTDICKHLNGQVRGFDEPFDGPNGEQFQQPSAHINCRSFIRFKRKNEVGE